jgi:chromosome segregation ATPase
LFVLYITGVISCFTLRDALQVVTSTLGNATANNIAAQTKLKAAQAEYSKVKARVMQAPYRLAELSEQVATLRNVTIPRLRSQIASTKEEVAAAEKTAAAAAAKLRKAEAYAHQVDDELWDAQNAWQEAEDKVDDLLSQKDALVGQLADMVQFFMSGKVESLQGDSADATYESSGEDTATDAVEATKDLPAALTAITDSKGVLSVQYQVVQSAADLKAAYENANSTAAAAYAAGVTYQAVVEDLDAAHQAVETLQPQLDAATATLLEAKAALTRKQEEVAAKAAALTGSQDALMAALEVKTEKEAALHDASDAVGLATAENLAAQGELAAANAVLGAAKQAEFDASRSYYDVLQSKVEAEGHLAGVVGQLAAVTVSFGSMKLGLSLSMG